MIGKRRRQRPARLPTPPDGRVVRDLLETIIRGGTIGVPAAVDLRWTLDTNHGADHFRRRHSERRLSGDLPVHTASHHFDNVNWWIVSYRSRY